MTEKTKNIVLWAGSALLALAFLGAGATKLSGNPEMAANFARWGFPEGFMYVVGALEVAGAIGLLLPRLAGYAAPALVGVMLGAIGTHVLHAEWGAIVPPLVLLTGAALVTRARRSPVLARLGLLRPAHA